MINPQLGRLLELNESTLAQAVVVAKSCMVADALATAAIAKDTLVKLEECLTCSELGTDTQCETIYCMLVKVLVLYVC